MIEIAKIILYKISSLKINVRSGKNVFIGAFNNLNNVQIGDFTYIAGKSRIRNAKIGSYTSIAKGLNTGFGTHPTNFFSTSPIFHSINNVFKKKYILENNFEEFKETKIGNDVWIGLNVILMDGVNIGDGSIIAAGSVVTKNVPPYSIVGGVPAKLIKMRFDNDTINVLQNSKWWENDAEEIISKLRDLVGADLDQLKNKLALKKIKW